MSDDADTYDIPKTMPVNYDWPSNLCRTLSTPLKNNSTQVLENFYDTPRPNSTTLHHQNTMTPSNSNSSLLTCDCSFSSSSNRLTLANLPDYDVPRRNHLPVRQLQPLAVSSVIAHQPISANDRHSQNEAHLVYSKGFYNLPPHSSQSSAMPDRLDSLLDVPVSTKDFPLEISSMLDTLAKLHTETILSISRLLSFVVPKWRMREKLEPVFMEVKFAIMHLRSALHDLSKFCEGVLYIASGSEDCTLGQKLGPLVKALKDADKLIQETFESIDAKSGWTLENLAINKNETNHTPDSFHQLIECTRALVENVRQTTSFIKDNALLLFKRNDLTGKTKSACTNENNIDLVKNYDYVCLESKDAAARKKTDMCNFTPKKMQKTADDLVTDEETAVLVSNIVNQRNELTDRDKLFLKYYAVQITKHMDSLRQAIDSFLEAVEKNQPPKFFIAYGKIVVASAHNLVTMGDIVHRNLSGSDLKQVILRCTEALTESIKTCVFASKNAVAHFPSVAGVQDMVDSVVAISHLAVNLKTTILHAVQLII